MAHEHMVGRCNWCNRNTSQEHLSPITFNFEPEPQFVCGPDCGSSLHRAVTWVSKYHRISAYSPYIAAAAGLSVFLYKFGVTGMAMACLVFLAGLGAATVLFPSPPISLVRSVKTRKALNTMRIVGAIEVLAGFAVYLYVKRYL